MGVASGDWLCPDDLAVVRRYAEGAIPRSEAAQTLHVGENTVTDWMRRAGWKRPLQARHWDRMQRRAVVGGR